MGWLYGGKVLDLALKTKKSSKSNMGGVALSLLTIVILGFLGIYLLLSILKNLKPGRTKIQKDLALIKADLQPWLADLVPWSEEEMEQLSLNQINRKSKKGVSTTAKGIYTTVYHEPVIAWSYKKYVSQKENAVAYARTTDHEFIYRIKDQEVEIVANNKLLGILDAKGALLPAKGQKMLAQINRQSEALALPVIVNGKQVGSLTNASKSPKQNARAFQMIAKMSKEEEEMFLALGVLELIKRSV
jgi:hypothetical protein